MNNLKFPSVIIFNIFLEQEIYLASPRCREAPDLRVRYKALCKAPEDYIRNFYASQELKLLRRVKCEKLWQECSWWEKFK